jgi:hypothetical protein
VNRSLLPLLSLPLVALFSTMAEAAETGNIRGHVDDDGGLAVPGATVILSGPNIAGEMSATTDDNGDFRFLNIPPGTHSLKVVKSGLAPTTVRVTVRLDETAFAPIVLTVAGGAEVVVEETLPVIDVTRSAISTELSDAALANLPVGRSYQDAVVMIPGVSGRVDTQEGGPSTGNPSVRGEGQYGNNYMLDGISTRDPATKTFGTNVNFDAISDIQVYTDGAPAEFGQATGMLVNVVTKDGGDEHHGAALYQLGVSAGSGTYGVADLSDSDGDGIVAEEVEKKKRNFLTHDIALSAGGPIVKERLWYFAAVDFSTGKTRYEGMTVDYMPTALDGFAKVTFFASPALTVRAQFSGAVQDIANYQTSPVFTEDAQSQYHSDDYAPLLSAEWRPSANTVWEAEALYQNGHVNVSPASDSADAPQIFDADTGQYFGNYDSYDLNQRGRMGATLKLTQLVDNFLGDHRFKLGGEFWRVTDTREIIYTGQAEGNLDLGSDTPDDPTDDATAVQYTRGTDADGTYWPCEAEDRSDCLGKKEYKSVGALGHTGLITSWFIQDDWVPAKYLTMNVGIRADHEELLQNEGDSVVSNWMIAPRLGGAWDVTHDSKTLLSAAAGRYYDVAGNSFADWGDTRSAYVYAQYEQNGDGTYTNVFTQDPEANPLIYCNDQSLSGFQDRLATGGLGEFDAWQQRAYYEDNICNGALRPYHMDKLALSLKRELFPLFAVSIRGILSKTVDLPEDVDFDYDNWVITNPDSKSRDYKALEFTAEKKFDKHWQLLASYTLSESKGTMPGQFELPSAGATGSNGNEVGVYLDDISSNATRTTFFDNGLGWFLDGLAGLGTLDDDAGYYGYLPYHSFHVVKLNGSYTFNFGTTVGIVYEFDSGHAWQKRGYVDLYQDYFAFPEGRGSRFMPPVNYVDIRIAHQLDFGNQKTAELSVNIYNLFDFETPITYYENDNESFGLVLYRQAPRSIEATLRVTY